MRRTRNVLIAAAVVAAIFGIDALIQHRPAAATQYSWAPSAPQPQGRGTPLPSPQAQDGWHRAAVDGSPRIQIAILLDTSGSMDGLIDQTRREIWDTVTTLTRASRDGKKPKIDLALYKYGIVDHPETGYVQQVAPFTDALDLLSARLMELQTTGSEEYCGQVIHDAVNDLGWSTNPDDMKMIFIAGNESFDQGPFRPHAAIAEARAKGITVTTIHCGPEDQAVTEGWRQAAVAGAGQALQINHNEAVVQIAAPQDKEIMELGDELEKTYVPYGAAGVANASTRGAQVQQQKALKTYASSTIARNEVCNGLDDGCEGLIDNRGWDLVSANAAGTDVGALPGLPDSVKAMTPEQRKAWLDAQKAKRDQLQARIHELGIERDRFVAQARQKAAGAGTAGQAMIGSVRQQAVGTRWSFQ